MWGYMIRVRVLGTDYGSSWVHELTWALLPGGELFAAAPAAPADPRGQTDRQTDRQTEREKDRLSDRVKDRPTVNKKYTEITRHRKKKTYWS